jgi:hypothetical protein
MADAEKELLVTRTVTVTYRIPMSAYPGMTPEQAADYERNMPKEDKLEAMMMALQSENGVTSIAASLRQHIAAVVRIQDTPAKPVIPDIPKPAHDYNSWSPEERAEHDAMYGR